MKTGPSAFTEQLQARDRRRSTPAGVPRGRQSAAVLAALGFAVVLASCTGGAGREIVAVATGVAADGSPQIGSVLSAENLLPGGDSLLVVVGGAIGQPGQDLLRVHERLQHLYPLPVRLELVREASSPLAAALELTVPGAPFYAVVASSGDLLFRARRHPAADVHRQLMELLPGPGAELQPTPPLEPKVWTERVSRTTFSAPDGSSVPGAEVLASSDRIVILEAACSVCRRDEHVRRMLATAEHAVRYVVVGDRVVLEALPEDAPVRALMPPSELGLAPELGVVTRDVPAADPIILTVRAGVVVSVTRLASTGAGSGGRP